jgi:hypothetical protein
MCCLGLVVAGFVSVGPAAVGFAVADPVAADSLALNW